MDIRQLKYFVAIVEEGKISLAAKRLNIAQPPLSQQLKLLEEELDLKLFERSTRKISITDEGKVLYQKAKELLEQFDGIVEETKELSEGAKGILKIGTIASLGAKILPKKVSQFQEKFPNVKYNVWEGDPIRIMELLEKRIIEIGLVRMPIDTEMFECILLSDEPIVIATGNRWNPTEEDSIKISDLKNKPLMILKRQVDTSMYRHDSYIFDIIRDSCLKHGFEPNIICETSDIMTLLTWTYHDIGIAVIPESLKHLIPSPNSNLIFKRIVNPSLYTRTSALIWMKGRYLSKISRNFIENFTKDNAEE